MTDKVWSEFQRKNKDGSILKFIVRDCTKEQMEDVINIYFEYLMKEEAFQKISGMAFSEEARNECKPVLVEMLKNETNHVVVCVEENSGKVVGASIMELLARTKPERDMSDKKPQTKELIKLLQILSGKDALYHFSQTYSVDKWYSGLGVVVVSDYRGYGIGSALVKSRREICKEKDVPLTTAWMTSIGTQKAAERDGWETPFEIDSREFAIHFDATPCDGIAPTFKVMVAKP